MTRLRELVGLCVVALLTVAMYAVGYVILLLAGPFRRK